MLNCGISGYWCLSGAVQVQSDTTHMHDLLNKEWLILLTVPSRYVKLRDIRILAQHQKLSHYLSQQFIISVYSCNSCGIIADKMLRMWAQLNDY